MVTEEYSVMAYRYQTPQYYQRRPLSPPPRRRHLRWVVVPVAVLIVASVIVLSHIGAQASSSDAQAAASAKKTQSSPTQSQAAQQAGKTIQSIIAADSGDTIGVAIENVKTGAVTTYGSTSQFVAASTEKVLSAVTYYHLVEKGVVSLDDTVGTYPASYQLQQMINQSNNDSWNAINDALGGNDELQAYATSIGLHYNVNGNLMSPQDMATLLTKLYTGQLINADHTSQLLSYMQNTNDETLISAVLPSGLTLYHKYGELDDYENDGNILHDAAIVTDNSSTYAIVIYSSGQSGEDARTATIKQIAKAAFTVCGW